jgi:23S rRNA (adenine2503-C2)-methyltransferase
VYYDDDTPGILPRMAATPHLFSMTPDDLVAHLLAQGVSCRPDEARRVLAHFILRGARDFAMKRPVARPLRGAIDAATRRDRLRVVERVKDDDDGFVKYLFESDDGAVFEAVRIPLHAEGKFTVCVSSQVGCAMGCVFCATGRLGLTRNLSSWEIVAQVIGVRDELAEGQRISGVVFQGQGEPLHNYDEVLRAARVLSSPCGGCIEGRAITISTVGLVDRIRRYASEGHPYRLIISLTSAIAEKRRSLLPIAGKATLDDVADAIRALHRSTNDRVTIAWVTMSGVNTGKDEVEALRALLPDVPLRLNLIDVNDAREQGFRPASPGELARFLEALKVLEAPVVRRYSGGKKRDAGCGMLAARRHAAHDDDARDRGAETA